MNREKEYEIIKTLILILKLIKRKAGHELDFGNIGVSSVMILDQLEKDKPKTLTEITEKLGLPNSTASVLIDKLTKEGLLSRVRDDKDRRKVLICLTDKAINLQEQLNERHSTYCQKLLRSASDEEIDTILRGLCVFEKIMEEGDVI